MCVVVCSLLSLPTPPPSLPAGPNPDNNPALRRVLQNARSANMPKEKVESAIKKASGQNQVAYELVT